MIPAQATRHAQNHEHNLHILPKIVLAGLHDLLSPASVAELSLTCDRVFHHVLESAEVLAITGPIRILHVGASLHNQSV